MMTRIARCCCGALRAEVTGEPSRVGVCHCMACQRLTGSAFGVVAFFPKEQVHIEGPSKVYVRAGDSGRKVEFHFCPTAVPRYSGMRRHARTISASLLACSPTRRCPRRQYRFGRRRDIRG